MRLREDLEQGRDWDASTPGTPRRASSTRSAANPSGDNSWLACSSDPLVSEEPPLEVSSELSRTVNKSGTSSSSLYSSESDHRARLPGDACSPTLAVTNSMVFRTLSSVIWMPEQA